MLARACALCPVPVDAQVRALFELVAREEQKHYVMLDELIQYILPQPFLPLISYTSFPVLPFHIPVPCVPVLVQLFTGLLFRFVSVASCTAVSCTATDEGDLSPAFPPPSSS